MAAICSEEARQALDLITPRSQPGVSPIHVLDASWPMQRCAVEAQLSRKRDLTLLEKYTLRAFNEIPGVSAAEIADRLGLKEPELIDETLLALQNAEAIESSIAVDSSEEIAETREELRLLEDKMNANAFHGAVRRNMEKKRDILRQKIAKSESSRGLSLRDRISKVFERLMKFTAKLTTRGKKHLAEGTITEPTKKEIFDFSRSLGNGKVMMTKGHGFKPADLMGVANYWVPLKDVKRHLANPSERDVTDALRAGGELEGELVIQSLTPQNDPNQVEYLDICITLSISHEDDAARFYVHLRGGGVRLKWIEELVNSDPNLEKAILSKFKEMMPSLKNSTSTQASKAKPLVHINRLLINEIESGSKSLVVLNRAKDLLKLVDGSASLERLLEDRTSVDLDHQRKNWKLESEETPLKFSLPLGGSTLPQGSISTKQGSIHPAIAIVNGQHSNLSIELPVLVHSEELGKLNVSEIEARLRKEIDAKSCFLLTRSESDFSKWVQEEIAEVAEVEDMAEIFRSANELAKGTGIDVERTLFESLFLTRNDLFTDMIPACERLVSALSEEEGLEQGGWRYVEPYIQQTILNASLSETGTGELADAWQLHNSGKKQLAWEDAARLEDTYFGHCTQTKFEALRYFEDIIKEMAEVRDISTETVWISVDGLKRADVINSKLYEEATLVRKDRNAFTHIVGVKADLEYTLRVIALMRKLLEIGVKREGALWGNPTDQDWNHTLTEQQILDYLSMGTNAVQRAQDAGRSCRGSVWTGAIRFGMPTVFDGLPMNLITALHEAPEMHHEPQFNDLIGTVVENSLDRWIEGLQKPEKLVVTANVQDIVDKFVTMEMADVGSDIVAKFLAGVERPTSIETLVDELDNSTSLGSAISIENLRTRWKRAIKDKSFVVYLNNLVGIKAKSLDSLGKSTVDDLFRVAINQTMEQIEGGDVGAVKAICDSVVSLMGKNETWNKVIKDRDGFIGARCNEKMREGGDIIAAGKAIAGLMPIVDADELPKTNARFEELITAGEKAEKKEEAK